MKRPVLAAILILAIFAVAAAIMKERLCYGISRAYQEIYVVWQYNYYALDNPKYMKECSFGHKILCDKEHYSEEMARFLANPDVAIAATFYQRKNSKVSKWQIEGRNYIVKYAWTRGVLKNLLKHNRGVTIWNTTQWLKDLALPVITPVALVERRSLGYVETFFIYEMRPRDGLKALAEEGEKVLPAMYRAIHKMSDCAVIHQDLRPRNIVEGYDGNFEYIDLDVFHRYPCHSYIYWNRFNSELARFNQDVLLAVEAYNLGEPMPRRLNKKL